MALSPGSAQMVHEWLRDLRGQASSNLQDDPNYYMPWPENLVTSSQPKKFMIGTGRQVLQDILGAFQSVQHEIILVTCFWAKSASQAALSSALRDLSVRALLEDRRIRVRICFSSISLWQKLTQTASLSGKEYPSSVWASMLGLPDPSDIQGLDLTVRSIFVWPLSVMHSKFVIIDRKKLFLPSCNVSWEDWLEGCIELRGDIVDQTLRFWTEFWGRDEPLQPLNQGPIDIAERRDSIMWPLVDAGASNNIELGTNRPDIIRQVTLSHLETVPTIILPSPHHRNPSFRLFSWLLSPPPPPPTPLNTFLLTIFSNAKQDIVIQSPNVNSPPVLSAISAALCRGVNVTVISNTNMMILEQLVTAGTLTEWALGRLYRRWAPERTRYYNDSDVEAGLPPRGQLEIFYYQASEIEHVNDESDVPVKSHLKLTVVDEEIVVLGSGNMDRASWYTSQELGIAFFSKDLALDIVEGVSRSMEDRLAPAKFGL